MDYFFAKFQKAIDGMLECASHAKQTLHSAAAGGGRGLAGETEIDRRFWALTLTKRSFTGRDHELELVDLGSSPSDFTLPRYISKCM